MMGKDAGMTVHLEETLTAAGCYDVLVAGGGLSGAAAALSAGRCGKRVLLIEKQCRSRVMVQFMYASLCVSKL